MIKYHTTIVDFDHPMRPWCGLSTTFFLGSSSLKMGCYVPPSPPPPRVMVSQSIPCDCPFKGTQAWDNFEFFFYLIKSLYALRKFSKKSSLLFLRFSPEFWCSNISAVTEHTRNQIFLMSYPKIFFLQNLHFGPIRWVPRWFSKISIIYSQN